MADFHVRKTATRNRVMIFDVANSQGGLFEVFSNQLRRSHDRQRNTRFDKITMPSTMAA